MKRFLKILFAGWLLIPGFCTAENASVTLPSGIEVVSQHFHTANGPLLLWFTGQYGNVEAEQRAAARLAEKGMDVWLTDWLAPYFLPQLPGSIAKVPDQDLADWLAAVQNRYPGRQLFLAASGHTAELALRSAKAAQARRGVAVRGSVLLFPLLYQTVEPGAEPDYDPVVDVTRLKLAVLVPKASAGFWWRERLKERLEAAGSWVNLTVMPGLRDGFYRRSDATDEETGAGANLGETLWRALQNVMGENKS